MRRLPESTYGDDPGRRRVSLSNPIVVFVEPDADADGFGDERGCMPAERNATRGCLPCGHPLRPRQRPRRARVNVTVTTNTAAPVKVEGVVKLGKRKKGKKGSHTQQAAPNPGRTAVAGTLAGSSSTN